MEVYTMDNTLKLGRVAGIEIGAHYTWLFAFALVAWSLANGFFPANYPGWTLRARLKTEEESAGSRH
jgi:hypothetical protein